MNDRERPPSPGRIRRPHLVGMAILIVVVAGLLIDVSNAGSENDNFYGAVLRLQNTAQMIHQRYVEEVQSDTLTDFGVNGMLRTLDPHTSYFNTNQYKELMMHTEGKFGGLGIQISIRDKILTVMTPIAGTPASRAGIQSGDQIVTIDGKSTAGITIDKAVSKLRGDPGTKVTITIRRKGEAKDLEYVIIREVINIKPVPFYGVIDSGIGYIYLSSFSKEAGAEVEKAIRELAAKKIRGLVFDLRFDPGGLLPEAKEIAGKFLPAGSLVVSTRGRMPDQNQTFASSGDPALPPDIPLAVLVNYASASASEIVTGAIQDWDRGVVVGDTTFGKGSVQSVFPIEPDGKYHIKLTTAFYYTPSGRCINRPENGIRGGGQPDNDLDAEDTAAATAADTALSAPKNAADKVKKDTTRYRTKGGRTVFGGGGIIPDTVIHERVPNVVIRSLFGKDVFFKFANLEYVRLTSEKPNSREMPAIDGRIMGDFYRYLDSIKFSYQSIAQGKFDEFKVSSELRKDTAAPKKFVIPGEKPQWTGNEMTELAKAASLIDSLLSRESRRALAENERDVKRFLTEALLIRFYGQDCEQYYRFKLADDPQLSAAIGFLKDPKAYGALLKPKTSTADKKQ